MINGTRFYKLLCFSIMIFQTALFSQTESDYVDSKLYEYIDDGSWCWFQDERAVVDTEKGKLVIGTANMKAGVDLIVFDIESKKVENAKRYDGLAYADDHNAPGMLVMPNGNYLALWAHHYDSMHRYSIYSNGGWSNEQSIKWSNWGNISQSKVCYSNVYYLSDEKRIYNCARAINKAPNFCYSDDNGESWKYGGQLTTNNVDGYNKGYYKYWGNGVDRIDIVLTEAHPREQGTSLYHGYIKDHKMHNSKGDVIDDDVYNGSKMPTDDNFTKVFANGTNVNSVTMERCWQHDIVRYDDGTVAILFKARANNNELDHRNFIARFDGNEWKTTYLGKAGVKVYDSEQDYTGLGALCPDNPNRIYLSTPFNPGDDNSNAGKREIWRGTTQDNGATWKWEPVTANSTVDNFRPIVPKWKTGKEALLWFRGTYRKAQDITAKVVGTFYEDPVIGIEAKKDISLSKPHGFRLVKNSGDNRLSIHYSVSGRASVKISVYNLNGKKVVTLANQRMVSGSDIITWNTKNLSSGMYFVRLAIGERSYMQQVNIQ